MNNITLNLATFLWPPAPLASPDISASFWGCRADEACWGQSLQVERALYFLQPLRIHLIRGLSSQAAAGQT